MNTENSKASELKNLTLSLSQRLDLRKLNKVFLVKTYDH